jgi:nitroreductase/dihydropteridine reductase
MDYISKLNWRYATKRMNGSKIPEDKLDRILSGIQLSASSMGFQPYNIYVIESDSMKKNISQKACTQAQVLESSHLIVFSVWTEPSASQVDKFFQLISETRNQTLDSLSGFKKSVESSVLNKSKEEFTNWNARQAYIALGFGLVSAAMENVDATPMEGFNGDAMDDVLGLKAKNQKSVVLLALGYRDESKDPLSQMKKVRRPKNELFSFL